MPDTTKSPDLLDDLMSREEAAEILGIKPESVRHVLRRYGVEHVSGYPPDRVRWVADNRKGRGRRTDLHPDQENPDA